MIKDIISVYTSGQIEIFDIIDNQYKKVCTRQNAILPNAKYLISRLLLNDLSAQLTNIRVYNGASLVANGPITVRTYVNPNEVHYEVLFSNTSFSGPYTKMTLGPVDDSTLGDFSQVLGLALTKLNTAQLLITWNIKTN